MSKITECIRKDMGDFDELGVSRKIKNITDLFGIPIISLYDKRSLEHSITIRLDYGLKNKKRARIAVNRFGQELSRCSLFMWGYDMCEEPWDWKCLEQYAGSKDMGDFNVTEVCAILARQKKEFGQCPSPSHTTSVEEQLTLLIDYNQDEKPRAKITHIRRVVPNKEAEVVYKWGYGEATETKWEEAK